MKKTVLIMLVILVAIQADGFCQKKKYRYKEKADTIAMDSLEYQLIILDPGFESWLATKPPKEFYSKDFYEYRNRLYVSEWNQRYLSSRFNGLYETYIDYKRNIDYGLDLNYKLYYYFRYFEESNKVSLYPSLR
jgi:hypothetical protein